MLVQGIHSSLIIQAMQHVNIATVATEQIGQYTRSTTSVMNRLLDDKQRPGKHVSNDLIEFFCFWSMLENLVINKVTDNLSNNNSDDDLIKSEDNNESDLTDGEQSPTEMACERREALSDSRDRIVCVFTEKV